MNPLVSVIIPNYCHAKYLEQRINSVLNQTYQYIEVIILDDKSLDRSVEVIEKYRGNPKISHIIYNEENSGSTFKQWQKGFSLIKGEFIWIAESDDYCELNFLETLLREYRKYPKAVLLYTYSKFVDANGVRIWYNSKEIEAEKSTDRRKCCSSRKFIERYMLIGNSVRNASSAIFKRTAILSIDKNYMDYKAAGDRLFWIKIAEQGDVIIVKTPLNYFRQHTQKVSPGKMLDGTTFRENYHICKYLEERGYLNVFKRFLVYGYFLHQIYTYEFDSEDIRKNLLELWKKYSFYTPFLAKHIFNIIRVD